MKKKVIHFITVCSGVNKMSCDRFYKVHPIEDILDIWEGRMYYPYGTFNIHKVTCKRCLSNKQYKKAVEKDKMSLFHWRELAL